LNAEIKNVVDEEPNNLNYEPTAKIIEGSFIGNMLYKLYAILYLRKIVDVNIEKEVFMNAAK